MGLELNRRGTLAASLAVGASALPLAMAWSRARASDTKAPGDYMSMALRDQVDALKKDLETTPTNTTNYAKRGLILYDWMNAYALNGGYAHPDVPSLVASLYSPGFVLAGERTRLTAFGSLDQFLRSLGALEKDPGLTGTVTAKTDGPFQVDSHVTFSQTYTVGGQSILPGGGLILPNHFYFASEELQTSNPKADNFVTLTLSNPKVKFVMDTYPIAGMFSSRLGTDTAPRVFFRITEGTLRKGDRMTVTYGDRSGGSKGLHLIHISNSALRFPLWLVSEKNGYLLTPREAILPCVGGPAAGVHGFVPSIVKASEPFSLSIRTEDKFRNLATGPAPGWTVTLNGAPFKKVAASSNPITVLKNLKLATPGVYRFGLASADGRITGKSDPVLVEADPTTRIYWGETHGHCGFSEGMGKVDDYYKFARDEARLDFCTLSEHDLWLDAGEWAQMRRATKAFDRPGEFITFMGYEWTVVAAFGGHHNVIFRNIDGVTPVSCQRHPTLPSLYSGLRKDYRPKDVMVIPHAHMTADATQNDRDLEPLVEIVSEHGTFDWLGKRYLANGFQLGFIGAGDDHIGHPGYKPRPLGRYYFDGYGGLAAVYAPSKDRDPLFDAMKSRMTYATNSARIILKTQLNGSPMGQVVPSATTRTVEGVVHGTGPIESITLVKNGKDLRTLAFEQSAPGAATPDDIVEISFYSNSETALLTPARAIRTWNGQVIVSGAEIASVSSPQVEALNVLTEWARPSPIHKQAIDFRLVTRGDHKAIRLRLKDGPAGARVRIVLTETRVAFDSMVAVPAPGDPSVVLIARDEDPGGDRRGGGSFADEVAVRLIRPTTIEDRPFQFIDQSNPTDGDNYYVRVVQADGGMAWSSPGWVGAVKRARS